MQTPTPTVAAWHLGAAAAEPDEQVARALEASAERARQRGGASAAAFYLWRAAELTPDRHRAAERLLEAARAELVGGRGLRAREILERATASGLPERRQAEAAWTEALIHIVDGNVRQPAALLAEALPFIQADEPAVAVGACVAAAAIALVGGYLIEEPTPRAIAAGIITVIERCHIPHPIAQLVAGIATGLTAEHAQAVTMLRAAVTDAAQDHDTTRDRRRSQRPCRVSRRHSGRSGRPRRAGLGRSRT